MKLRLALTAIMLTGMPWATAQKVTEEPQEDPVQEAIREFNRQDAEKPNEVTVVLDPVGEPPAAPAGEEAATETPANDPDQPVLVTGKPREDADLVNESPPADASADSAPQESAEETALAPATDESAPTKPHKGLAVRVEKIQEGTGIMDPSKVKLLAPFPAKPLAEAPAGWRLEYSENAPPFTREVELAPGKKITLKVRPHLLVPEADGAAVFNVSEPGFDPAIGYRQNATVGAVLSDSIRQLDDDAKHLGAAIDNLQQLLVSLPKPEPKPEVKSEPSRKR
ncbi:MAG: hypothetical protein MUF13_13830 [Akkermansiaceae bacterium]|nr:hypothetical protein [Akkermansiaceae bacterium]